MDKMILMMAQMMPFADIVKMLKEACEEYESAILIDDGESIARATSAVAFNSFLFTAKHASEGKDIGEMMKEVELLKKTRDLLKPNTN